MGEGTIKKSVTFYWPFLGTQPYLEVRKVRIVVFILDGHFMPKILGFTVNEERKNEY